MTQSMPTIEAHNGVGVIGPVENPHEVTRRRRISPITQTLVASIVFAAADVCDPEGGFYLCHGGARENDFVFVHQFGCRFEVSQDSGRGRRTEFLTHYSTAAASSATTGETEPHNVLERMAVSAAMATLAVDCLGDAADTEA